ncbi:MAG: insulinase family protein [Candidatus Roizmanbacteria bacterium]
MKKIKDRLIFKSVQLDNGIKIYSKKMEVPFASVKIFIPVGHLHNTGEVLPGTAHLLEHIVYGRSSLYPEKNQFQKKIELVGGSFDAGTNLGYTMYAVKIKSDLFAEAFEGLMSHVFNSIIKDEDISCEIGIVSSERKRESKWYPGTDDLEYHSLTKWKDSELMSLKQIIGMDSDLKKMNAKVLSRFHKKAYFDKGIYVIVGGNFDEKIVHTTLATIKTKKHKLPIHFKQVGWTNKKYHEKNFEDVGRYVYCLGGVTTEHDLMTVMGINFIGKLLTNTVHGALFEWLRTELGWSYDMDFTFATSGNKYINSSWDLTLSVHTHKQVERVRKELHVRILQAINNKELVTVEVERQKALKLFNYQTLRDLIDEAESMLARYGRLYTETEMLEAYEKLKDTAFLQDIYNKHWSPEVTGEFLAMPK